MTLFSIGFICRFGSYNCPQHFLIGLQHCIELRLKLVSHLVGERIYHREDIRRIRRNIPEQALLRCHWGGSRAVVGGAVASCCGDRNDAQDKNQLEGICFEHEEKSVVKTV